MQTFLPYPSFEKSANCLDSRRLIKQLLEATQILGINVYKKAYSCKDCEVTINNPTNMLGSCNPTKNSTTTHKWIKTPWYNHPAVVMWRGYEQLLRIYIEECIIANCKRGYDCAYASEFVDNLPSTAKQGGAEPPWLGMDKFHDSHKSNLLRKDYDYYSRLGWTNDLTVEYWWPTPENMELYKKEQQENARKNTFLLTEEII